MRGAVGVGVPFLNRETLGAFGQRVLQGATLRTDRLAARRQARSAGDVGRAARPPEKHDAACTSQGLQQGCTAELLASGKLSWWFARRLSAVSVVRRRTAPRVRLSLSAGRPRPTQGSRRTRPAGRWCLLDAHRCRGTAGCASMVRIMTGSVPFGGRTALGAWAGHVPARRQVTDSSTRAGARVWPGAFPARCVRSVYRF